MSLINVLSISLPLFVCLIGSYRYRHLSAVQKIFLFQALIALFTEATGIALTKNNLSNTFIYNIYILFDVSLLLWAAIKMASPRETSFLFVAMLLFIGVWISTICNAGLTIFSNWSFLFGSILLITSYLYLIIKKWQQTDSSLFSDKHFWIQAGTAIYFGVNIPYFCLINYLNKHYVDLSLMLFSINIILLFIQYIFTFVSFYKSTPKHSDVKIII